MTPNKAARPIRLIRTRQNNLKNITVEFPAGKLSVITGLSGSGKSSLAFDTLYAEGQRRYIESLSTYTRQFLEKMPKPDVDGVENIPPAIALEQRNHVMNSRSTVGTQTEIIDYLRILYARIGKTLCSECGNDVKRFDPESILTWACDWVVGRKAYILAPLLTPETTTSSKKPASQKKKLARFESIATVLKEQGFQRLVRMKNPRDAEILDLESSDIPNIKDLASGYENGEFFVVIDRLKLSATPDKDSRARLLDSIEQALAVGQGKMGFLDLGTSPQWKTFDERFLCVQCGKEHRIPEPQLFSFNSPIGACQRCSGFGYTLDLDEALIVPDPTLTLKNGAVDPLSKPSAADWQTAFFKFAEKNGISIGKRYRELTIAEKKLIWEGDGKATGRASSKFPGIRGCFEELARYKYKLHVRVFIRRYQSQNLCTECGGSRLKKDALHVKIDNKSIADILGLSIHDALAWVKALQLTEYQKKIGAEAFSQIERRLSFLDEVGVGYLTLSRLTKTLSGGEFQRINLATQLGNGLCGTLYVLDEPSIGLHAADNDRLIQILKRLRDQGNTVVVVEHDLEVMRAADWLVELGPGAGARGGDLVAQGTAADLQRIPGSLTGKYLSRDFTLSRSRALRPEPKRILKLTGCRENNLKNLTVEFPLDRFVVVTGVSGSGKSTLVHKTLYQALSRLFYKTTDSIGRYDRLYGAEQVSGVVLLDQSPIGKSSRSNPATYLKAWDEVRRIYSGQTLSLKRGYTPQHFSFNVDGGRCPVCKGEGEITLDMHFMAEIKLPCEECNGKRFKKTVLDVSYRGKNIFQLLQTTIDETFEIFRDNSILQRKLGILREVGLGYLQLGQSATTLSGGESQRLKIAASLDDKTAENLLYIFDEPTTGLHLEDVKRLLGVIQDLVDARNSVVMIEHHLDVIAQSDWVIDLGPGGGDKGGELIAALPPQKLIRLEESATARLLNAQGYGPTLNLER